ncbi:MAG: hypothetical protein Q8K78_01005 [Planctomycetaceae bacterium]|nr:hypothetical protein [Planctomycetaceae bacterium]
MCFNIERSGGEGNFLLLYRAPAPSQPAPNPPVQSVSVEHRELFNGQVAVSQRPMLPIRNAARFLC